MPESPPNVPTKRQLLETLLDKGMVMVHLDARQDGVDVPTQFRDEAALALNLSYRFQGGLDLDEEAVRATLSFSGSRYTCEVPLGTIFAMVSHASGEGFFFPSDAPAEALASIAALATPRSEWDDAEGPAPALAPEHEHAHEHAHEREPKPRALRAVPHPDRPSRTRPVLRALDGGRGEPAPGPSDDDPTPVRATDDDAAPFRLTEDDLTPARAADDDLETTDAPQAELAAARATDPARPSADASAPTEEAASDTAGREADRTGSDGRPSWLRVIK